MPTGFFCGGRVTETYNAAITNEQIKKVKGNQS